MAIPLMTNCPLPSVQLIALELSSTFIVPATIGLAGGLTTTSLVCDSQVPLSIPTTKVVVVVRDGDGVILKLYTVPVGAGATEGAVVQEVVVPKLVRVPSDPFLYKTKLVGVPVVTLILSSTGLPGAEEQRFITLSPCAEASKVGGVVGTCGVTERVHTGPDGLVL